jgi:hypothetical protein
VVTLVGNPATVSVCLIFPAQFLTWHSNSSSLNYYGLEGVTCYLRSTYFVMYWSCVSRYLSWVGFCTRAATWWYHTSPSSEPWRVGTTSSRNSRPIKLSCQQWTYDLGSSRGYRGWNPPNLATANSMLYKGRNHLYMYFFSRKGGKSPGRLFFFRKGGWDPQPSVSVHAFAYVKSMVIWYSIQNVVFSRSKP